MTLESSGDNPEAACSLDIFDFFLDMREPFLDLDLDLRELFLPRRFLPFFPFLPLLLILGKKETLAVYQYSVSYGIFSEFC